MKRVNLKDLIAPCFYSIHNKIKNNEYLEYMLKGGRGSTKSSFVGIEIVYGMMRDAKLGIHSNAIVLRQVKDTLRKSVFEQIDWAIQKLGVQEFWNVPESKLEITYLPTGQKVLFRGMDIPKKTKSTKFKSGFFKYIWYEELEEFRGMEDIRMVNQSFIRGGTGFKVFYTYNPPKNQTNWVNRESKIPKKNRLVHHSDYTQVPGEWLGEEFLNEALHLKKVNFEKYEHEYLGLEVGTGLEIFRNLTFREISNEEISCFDSNGIRQGLDFGYGVDPVEFIKIYLNSKKKELYLIKEFSGIGVSNLKLFENIKENKTNRTIADSAEPKSINELRGYGLNVVGAKKGPDSVDFGIKFLSETIERIIIDPIRCPRAYKEFQGYELEVDRNGEVINRYPDKNNHSIDAVRYALEDDMKHMNYNKRPLKAIGR